MSRFGTGSVTASKEAGRAHALAFWLFAIGGLVGIVNVPTLVVSTTGPEMVALASNLVHNGFYGNPSPILNTGPSAANPPMYPWILALLMITLRNMFVVRVVMVIGCILMNALTAAWLPHVSQLFFSDLRPGIVASICWLLSVVYMPGWDVSYTTALFLLFCLYTATGMENGKPVRHAFFAGLLAGILFLLNPASMLAFLMWVAYLLFRNGVPAKRTIGRYLVLLTTFGFIAFGWALRNDLVLGSFVVRTNFGETFYASNNDCAQPVLIDNFFTDCYAQHHPAGSLQEAEMVLRLGEVKYDRMRIETTKAWILSHPGRFVHLTAERIFFFWFPSWHEGRFKIAVIWIATVLSLPGIALMAYQKLRVTLFVVAVFLVYPLMYYVVMASIRYRYPILWLTLLPAGYFIVWVASSVSRVAKSLNLGSDEGKELKVPTSHNQAV